MMIAVSHLSDTAFDDVCEVTKRPFIASHSNCRALCPSLRNLTDGMIRALADRGGVMGINLYSGFLDPEFAREVSAYQRERAEANDTPEAREKIFKGKIASLPRPSIDWVARHVLSTRSISAERTALAWVATSTGSQACQRGLRELQTTQRSLNSSFELA